MIMVFQAAWVVRCLWLLSRNKMAGVNSCFAHGFELEILKIHEDAVPQNIQNLAWKFSKD